MDRLSKAIAADGTVRVISAITTDTVTEAFRRHQTSPTATAALGRTMTGAVLLGASFKDVDRLTIKVEGDGPLESIIAEATAGGGLRGYVHNPQADLPPNEIGKFDVRGIVGNGMFHVIRESGYELGINTEPYIGSVPIVSGEIGEDLAFYLANSEQIPSAVMVGVLLQNQEPYVAAAGGVLVQMMPGANEHIITMIEDTIKHAPHVTKLVSEGATPSDLIREALGIIEFEVLEESDLAFKCTCSMERARSMVASVGRDEVASMLAEDKQATMTCGFCNEHYTLGEADLVEILNELQTNV
ncbi:MAG TPA: Hsp33 family molecular chaperone HslO [Pyrinomonadaceae bacterium]|nr:Hsp33 family molecular chaperone HslO [Pyrinomonadaceae bacterium]